MSLNKIAILRHSSQRYLKFLITDLIKWLFNTTSNPPLLPLQGGDYSLD
jgi:hypothetical protein